MTKSCETCMYFEETPDSSGLCRRHPPVLFELDEALGSTWPRVKSGDWCGEYEDANGIAHSMSAAPGTLQILKTCEAILAAGYSAEEYIKRLIEHLEKEND